MKLVHTGDLHIGKIVNGFSMMEDQKYILKQIYEISCREKADALILAGDIYDRAIPPAEAVVLLDHFLTDMAEAGILVFLISGNHDSPERLGFAAKLLEDKRIHIGGVYENCLKEVKVTDLYGEVTFVLMPFVRPATVEAKTSGEAAERMLSQRVKGKEREILVSHCFVTDGGREPELSDGETTVHVGGLDNVEASLLGGFDYVALGHIHKPQKIGQGNIYYAGAPLAYSFSEAGHEKSVNLVELGEEGETTVRRIPLKPLHEMRRIRGRLEELMRPEIVAAGDAEDYIRAELTDEEELIDPIGTLRSVYPNIMQIVLMKNEEKENTAYTSRLQEKRKSIPELFQDFYEMIRGEKPDEEKMEAVRAAARKAEEES